MGRRRRAREHALQVLYQIDLTGDAPADACRRFWAGRDVPEEQRAFATRLIEGVRREHETIDRLITGAAERWRLSRMPVVDRNILRIAIWELLHAPETPAAVVIDEAVEIARIFSSSEAAGFVNGVLDTIRKARVG